VPSVQGLARDRRDEERRRLVQSEDPAEHKRTAKAKQRVLFRDVADEWLAMQVKPNTNGKVAITRKSAETHSMVSLFMALGSTRSRWE
jgi:hypothetical protein